MLGDLSAAIALNNGDLAGNQNMFGLSGLTLGEHRVMLYQPDFIQRGIVAGVGKFMHCLRDRFVRLQAELADEDFIVLQNNVSAERE